MSSVIINGTCISGTCQSVEFFTKWSELIGVIFLLWLGFVIGMGLCLILFKPTEKPK